MKSEKADPSLDYSAWVSLPRDFILLVLALLDEGTKVNFSEVRNIAKIKSWKLLSHFNSH